MRPPLFRCLGCLAVVSSAFSILSVATTPPATRADASGGKTDRPRYRLIDIGTLGGRSSRAYGINDRGQVVGTAQTAHGAWRAFVWDRSSLRGLGTLGGPNSRAVDINNAGWVVGDAETASRDRHACLWRRERIYDLGTLGGRSSTANGINSKGTIVGTARRADGRERAFLYRNGRMRPLSGLTNRETSATAINDRGQVAGDAWQVASDGWPSYRIFIQYRGRVNAGSGYGYGVRVAGISDSGEVVGNYDELEATVAARWKGGSRIQLGYFCEALDIDSRGTIVGSEGRDWVFDRAFSEAAIWEHGKRRLLRDLVDTAPNWKLRQATAINERGEIVGIGRQGSDDRAFLLLPISR